MADLRVERRRRDGQERLYVERSDDGTAVAWYDAESGEIMLLSVADRYAALEALGPYLRSPASTAERDLAARRTAPAAEARPAPAPAPASAPTPAPAPTPSQEAHRVPAADLAANAPGAALRRLIEKREPSRLRRTGMRWRGTDEDLRPWEAELRGERITGASLNKLRRDGWYVLHSIQLPGGSVIDHLVIGPSGVFTVDTEHHPGANVWVGDHEVTVNGERTPYLPGSLQVAKRVARVLGDECRFEVEVRAVLAVVGAADTTDETAIPSVLVVDGARAHQRLSGLAPSLPPDRRERIFTAARSPRTWVLA